MVIVRENPVKILKWMMTGGTPMYGNTHIYHIFLSYELMFPEPRIMVDVSEESATENSMKLMKSDWSNGDRMTHHLLMFKHLNCTDLSWQNRSTKDSNLLS